MPVTNPKGVEGPDPAEMRVRRALDEAEAAAEALRKEADRMFTPAGVILFTAAGVILSEIGEARRALGRDRVPEEAS